MVGVVNGFNRLGSILNFLVAPWLYRNFGLRAALLVPSAIGACCLITGVLMHRIDARLAAIEAADAKAREAQAEEVQADACVQARAEAEACSRVDAGAGVVAGGGPSRAAPPSLRRGLLCNLPFWLYLTGAMCVYGAVVPFWFIGGNVLQARFGLDLASADAMVLLPEGAILVVTPRPCAVVATSPPFCARPVSILYSCLTAQHPLYRAT